MSNDDNKIVEIPLEIPTENIPLDESLIKLEEFRKWIKDHPEYPQKMSNFFCYFCNLIEKYF